MAAMEMNHEVEPGTVEGSPSDRNTAGIDLPPKSGGVHSFEIIRALLESEQFLTAYDRASRTGLGIVDREFRYVKVNETLAEMNGLPAPAHFGKTLREVLGDCAGLIEPTFERVLATEEPVCDIEISFVLPTRTETGHWLMHSVPLRDETGNVSHIGAIIVEVTEKKKLEVSLRQEKKRQHRGGRCCGSDVRARPTQDRQKAAGDDRTRQAHLCRGADPARTCRRGGSAFDRADRVVDRTGAAGAAGAGRR